MLVLIFVMRSYYEAVFVALLIDLLYANPNKGVSSYVFTIIFLIVIFIIEYYLKPRLRLYKYA